MSAISDLRQEFEQYLTDLFVQPDPVMDAIYQSPEQNDMPMISVTPIDGHLIQWIMRLVGVRKAVEIGALAGYSGAWIARALPEDGKLYSLEKSSKHVKVARENYEFAQVADKIELLEGSALDLFPKIAPYGPFDMVFLDADKASYPQYLMWAIDNLRIGGAVLAHNAFRRGGVMRPDNDDDRGMDAFNRALAGDKRLDSIILPLGDAMAVGIRRV
jgi:caffeoyl-CoA O-methyltransferase